MPDDRIFEYLKATMELGMQAKHRSEFASIPDANLTPSKLWLTMMASQYFSLNSINGYRAEVSDSDGTVYTLKSTCMIGNNSRGFTPFTFIDQTLPKNLDPQNTLDQMYDHVNEAFHMTMKMHLAECANSLDNKDLSRYFNFISDEAQVEWIGPDYSLDITKQEATELANEITDKIRSTMPVKEAYLGFDASVDKRYFLNSEGTLVFETKPILRMVLGLSKHDSEERLITEADSKILDLSKGLPSYDEIMSEYERLGADLEETIAAPMMNNCICPVIMDPKNHGVLWHEVVGHALEGHRLIPDYDGDLTSLFMGRIGEQVAPEFVTVIDDPTMKNSHASYMYDDEGVKSQPVTLIERGVLKDYLHSRASAGYQGYKQEKDMKSNGHSRADMEGIPHPRMSNLRVIVDPEYENELNLSGEQVKEIVVAALNEEGADDYALRLEGTSGGLTLPEDCHFNTFPSKVFKITPDGKEERVRGLYIVGSPLITLQNLAMMGTDYDTFNGSCGAESGFVTATEIAPTALFGSIEFNRIPESSYGLTIKKYFEKPDLWAKK